MTYNTPTKDFAATANPLATLGDPQLLAEVVEGQWTTTPKLPLTAVRHRLDTLETTDSGFLFVPELFARLHGSYARSALLSAYKAFDRGAAALLATSKPRNLSADSPCLIVKNPSRAIERLAQHAREQSKATFFAVTGSVGKTTTKDMIYRMASTAGLTHRSIANYNDGMDSINFTLSGLSLDHQYCSVEFSEVGELEEQIERYCPDVAIITNVKAEHINRMERQGYEGEQALERLAYLAAGLARGLRENGICILNADEENFGRLSAEVRKCENIQIKTCGTSKDCDVKIIDIRCDGESSKITIFVDGTYHSYRLGIPGRHMAVNSVLAAAAIHFSGINLISALPALESFHHVSRRGTTRTLPWKGGQITLIDESFSSSIPSLQATLRQLAELQPTATGRRVAVLGQINGIGREMPAVLSDFARKIEDLPIDRFYTIGSDIRIFNESFGDRQRMARHAQTLAQLEKELLADLKAGDVVMFKGTDTPQNISLRQLVDRLVRRLEVNAAAPEESVSSRRVIIGGDTYFGEYYQEKRAKSTEINYLETFGYDYSTRNLQGLFDKADLAVVNLECALTDQSVSPLAGQKDYILAGDPSNTVQALKALNIGGVLLGNNHAMDFGADGLQSTLSALGEAGIAVSGAGAGRMQAQLPVRAAIDVDGIEFRIAILSGYEFNAAHDEMQYYADDASRLGVNNINFGRLERQIAELKRDGYFVVVSPHWGANYHARTYHQCRLAERIVDVGADLVLGHGPHMMNEIRQLDGVWVAYSLGNLVFNSEGEYERRGVHPYSLIAELQLSRASHGVSARLNLYPIVSCNQMTQFQPTFVDAEQFSQVVECLANASYDRSLFLQQFDVHESDEKRYLSFRLF
jgi:UDP-N-acetylmuramyl pentapeptide synthase